MLAAITIPSVTEALSVLEQYPALLPICFPVSAWNYYSVNFFPFNHSACDIPEPPAFPAFCQNALLV